MNILELTMKKRYGETYDAIWKANMVDIKAGKGNGYADSAHLLKVMN